MYSSALICFTSNKTGFINENSHFLTYDVLEINRLSVQIVTDNFLQTCPKSDVFLWFSRDVFEDWKNTSLNGQPSFGDIIDQML